MAVQGIATSISCLRRSPELLLERPAVTTGTQQLSRAVSARAWVLSSFRCRQPSRAPCRPTVAGSPSNAVRGRVDGGAMVKCTSEMHPVAVNATVVVTRERGKNGKLIKALGAKGIQCLELPLIEHVEGPDLRLLPDALRGEQWDWVVITSPEAAAVFLEGWRDAGKPGLRVATVGGGTTDALVNKGEGLDIAFTPSKATGKVLAAELPNRGGSPRVLYPASAKAGNDVQAGLEERGFQVTRLSTYSTETVKDLDPEILAAAAASPVATFASPSTVKAWVEYVASTTQWDGAAACIGATSAEAAKKAGLKQIFFPERPGIDGWVASILDALEATGKTKATVA